MAPVDKIGREWSLCNMVAFSWKFGSFVSSRAICQQRIMRETTLRMKMDLNGFAFSITRGGYFNSNPKYIYYM